MKYAAFMSYSHAADPDIASAIQKALHGFAKPIYRRRALHVFRDKTSLSANPALWPAIEQALADSEFFILLASPLAVQSPWVQREVEWWLTHRSIDRLLIVLTEGALVWDGVRGDFDWNQSAGIPSQLQGRLGGEPLYVDLRWAKAGQPLSLRDPQFRGAVLDLAATLHGRPKDDLDGQDIREYRRTRLLASAGVAVILILAIVAVWLWRVAARERDAAVQSAREAQQQAEIAKTARDAAIESEKRKEEERRRALARQLAADAELVITDNPARVQTSMLLGLESLRLLHFFNNERLVRAGLALLPDPGYLFARHMGGIGTIAVSPNGRHIATAGADNLARIWDLSTRDETLALKQASDINSVAFNRNGKYIATGSADKSAALWHGVSGKRLAWLRGPFESIQAVAFHPDHDQLVTAGSNGAVYVWRVPAGTRIRALSGHTQAVYSIAFSADGRYAATASADGTARIWDAREWAVEPLKELQHTDDVIAVAFSSDGQLVATAGADAVAQVWKVPSGEPVARLHHGGAVRAAAFIPDGRLVTGSADGTVRAWVVSPSREVTSFLHQGDVVAVSVSPDGRYVATASTDRTARIWDLNAAVEVSRMSHDAPVTAVAFTRDGQRVVTSSLDGTARVWRRPAGGTGTRLHHPGAVHWVTFSADATKVATASADKSVRVWTTGDGAERLRLPDGDTVYAVALSPDAQRLATAGAGRDAVIWNAETGRRISALTHGKTVSGVTFSPDGRYIATGSLDGTARLWDASSGRPLATWTHAGSVYSVAFSPDSRYVATVSLNANAAVRVWATDSRKEVSGIQESFEEYWKDHSRRTPQYRWGDLTADDARYALAFSPDSRLIATASLGHAARVWQAANGRDVARLVHDGRVVAVAFSPDGHHVATGSEDGTVRVWKIETETEKAEVIARMTHHERVNAVAFNKNGDRVASLSSDNSVRVWETSTGRLLTQFEQKERIVAIAFSPDGRYLSIAGGDSVTLHALSRDDLIRQACERLNPNVLRENERKPYISDPYNPVCRDSTIVGKAPLRK
jgi:WD40 repeat protein